jgi:flagellar biogenesis protein FliO
MIFFFIRMLILLLVFAPELSWSDEIPPSLPASDNPHYTISHETPLLLPEEEQQDFYSQFIHMLVILGLLVGFLILASWFMKWLQTSRLQGINRAGLIKILESRQLSPRSAVHFIEILNKGIIIGESHAGLVRLAEMPLDSDEEEETDERPIEKKFI